MTVSDCTISGNTAVRGGGGGILAKAPTMVSRCTITGNSAVDGGGIWVGPDGAGTTLSNSAVYGNEVNLAGVLNGNSGADLFNVGSTVSISDSAVVTVENLEATTTYSVSSPTATVTGLTASFVSGQIELTAQVLAVDSSAGTPAGPDTVTLYDGNNNVLSTATLDANGQATFSDPTIVAAILGGQAPIHAVYSPAGTLSSSTSAPLIQVVDALTPDNLQTVVNTLASNPATAVALDITPSSEDAALSAVNGLTGLTGPVSVVLNLLPPGSGEKYHSATASPPNGVTLIINGVQTNTIVDPDTPALVVTSGNVIVRNVTFTEAGAAPTILVSGGNLTLRNDVVQSSTGYSEPAIAVSGGSTLDLGTPTSPGGNTIIVNGGGQVLVSTGVNVISTAGSTFQVNGAAVTPFAQVGLASSVNPALLGQSVTFTATVSAPAAGSAAPTGKVTFVDRTTGSTLATVALSGGQAQWTSSTLALGPHTIAAVYSGDGNYITSATTMVQHVDYHFSGFLAPLNSNLALGLGRTVPIKFQLTDSNGNYISSLSAVTSLQVVNAQGTNVLTNTGSTCLRYDPTSNQFVANWQTKGLPTGTYTVRLVLADGSTQTKTVQLTASGKGSNAQAADGSDVSSGGIGGQLLGGDLGVYVDNGNGELTPDELARIQDAVTAIDAVTEPYGVTVEETTDPSQAAVTLGMGSTSPVGGYADGVLGCFDPTASQITMIQGWNWYAGADPAQVGAGQYDFQTTLTHELGHALGLGESGDPTSAMYGTLAPGTALRTLTTADLNLPSDEAGADAQRAAAPPADPSPAATASSPPAATPASGTPSGPAGLSGFQSLLLALFDAEVFAAGGMPSAAVSDLLFANVGDVLLIDLLLAEQAGAVHA